ncbi:protein IQ-DOMAIN 32 [Humulus lupulus]|uniref:protein IQ-DOMAIN 32 n=1 Tax=Humulus lupulus TaxID=3486 RepID=UPI002B412671|nr:protein IQ-DOMAIN 32 [Humulus lupulus]
MGKSTSSCFKIITCGSDSAEKDDLELAESKGPSDKRGWSFRKRSARHRVLSNTVITETPAFGNKEGPDSATPNFEAPADTNVPEKITVLHCNSEKSQLPTPVNPKDSITLLEVTTESEAQTDDKLDEAVVIAIQTAARGFLAQRALLKHKNVVKLQAAVRGHLVRKHAVGTLRCVQAIVKMQALVRARHARLTVEGPCQNSDGKKQETSANKSSGTSAGMEKLLSNKFARQLLESTPKTKPIDVKCDPSKSDSAWKWLERWMSVSTVSAAVSKNEVSVTEQQGEKNENFESLLEDTTVEPEVICESMDSKLSVHESAVQSESEDNLITYEADEFDFQAGHSSTSSARDNLEQPQQEHTRTSDVKVTSVEINSIKKEYVQSDVDSQLENNSLSGGPETEAEQPKRSMKRLATDELETESKKFVYGSKKTSNPSFMAAQSKFEELSLGVNLGQPMSSSNQESGDESHKDTFSFEAHSEIRTKEVVVMESPVHGSRLQIGGSECGTELSVTSTLDSPDRSDIVAIEREPEAKVSDEEICNPNPNNIVENLDLKEIDVPTIPESNLSHSIPEQPENLDVVHGDSVSSVITVNSPPMELNPERNTSDFQRESEYHSITGAQAHALSPQASPRSHMTAAESQGTPASHMTVAESQGTPASYMSVSESQGTPGSQVSVKAKRNRSGKSRSDQKRESLSAIKKSPSNASHESGSRSSMEKLPKDQKNGKRHSSFVATKLEHSEQEPRDSSSNSSIPHFMQATESARAKLNANSSPRSSPDVQDRDIYIKKRHSLPGTNGRQGSPRIERSTSQAQQGTKSNERKWQR